MMFSTAERESDSPSHSGRLWSLWEMLQIYGNALFGIAEGLEKFRFFAQQAITHNKRIKQHEMLLERLLPKNHKFFDKNKQLRVMISNEILETKSDIADHNISRMNHLNNVIELVQYALSDLNMPISIKAAERIKTRLNSKETPTVSEIEELSSRIKDELDSCKFLFISGIKWQLYEPSEPLFGQEAQTKFASIAYEIEEAAKCLALERSTASVFHSIRSLEAVIRALARCLGIPDPTKASDRNWGNILKAVKDEIDRRWPNASNRLSGDGQFFYEAYAGLAALQNPWRNATMHLDQKYTEEEARHIFEIVGGFTKKIASRMDENGEPRA